MYTKYEGSSLIINMIYMSFRQLWHKLTKTRKPQNLTFIKMTYATCEIYDHRRTKFEVAEKKGLEGSAGSEPHASYKALNTI